MAINSVGFGPTILNQSLLNLNNQLTILQSQLTTGKKSTSYSGMGVNEGFAIAARGQLANIAAFTDTQTNINTNIGIANTALQGMVDIGTTVLNWRQQYAADLEHRRTNDRPANRNIAVFLDAGYPQHAGRRPLLVFRRRYQYAIGSFGRRHPERNHHAGRAEAGDLRTQAGRSRHCRTRAPRDNFADGDVGKGGGGCRRFAVRLEAERGLINVDGRNNNRPHRLARRHLGRSWRRQSQ